MAADQQASSRCDLGTICDSPLAMLHPKGGHSIEKLIAYNLKQYTSPIITQTKSYWYVPSLHKVAYGLYALCQVSWLYTCIPLHESINYFLWSYLLWFSTNPCTQIIAAKTNAAHGKLFITFFVLCSVVAVAIVLPLCCYRSNNKPFSISSQCLGWAVNVHKTTSTKANANYR